MSIVVNTTSAKPPPREGESASSAESLVALMQQAYTQQYTEARNQYKASHARFTARLKRPPLSQLERYCTNVFRDLSFYTSAINAEETCAPSVCTHGPRRIGIHSVNHELRLRAQKRLRAAPAKPKRDADDVLTLLVAQEAAEYADLLELEAKFFMGVARAYYQTIFGPTDDLVWLEAQARRSFEDEYNRATMAFLAQLREEIWGAEQRLLLRALGMFPDALPHVGQLRLIAAERDALQQAKLSVLESREAAPLWQRVCAIRGETESEEDIIFRRILLACVVEAHGISEGYLRYDTVTGRLRHTYKEVPPFMRDVIDYSMQFEPFAAVLEEETQRMRIAEEAEGACASLAAALASGADAEGNVSSTPDAATAPIAPSHADQTAAEA
ncbi:paraflagellar component 17 / PFC17 [Leishmania donovani]|uniref:Hypothetical_protein_conserved n=1 Tax=Leishmania donovani TaxID=5661 RepID=A0A504WUN7_LEIDO|nr:hypothetical protein CGC20_12630 [Leishmania donovani]CAJ1990455.1 paraflagellar component 17 / PFC17 [Leishmania donovani]VDZ46310.1 hypothetical_protein_conserved [Leishmania donovani]